MASLVTFLFSIRGAFVGLVAAAIWLRVRPASPAARRFLVCVIAVYALASTYLVPRSASRILLSGFHAVTAADLPAGRTAIVVLGAGAVTVQDWSLNSLSMLEETGGSRVLEAFRVYRLLPDAVIISSGGVSSQSSMEEPDGVVMRDVLVDLGVPASRVIVEALSQDTHEEAVLIAPMLRPLDVSQVVLVTSDVHMRRSVAAFRAQGVEVIPAIARDPYASRLWRNWLLPTEQGLDASGQFAHEIFGIGYYTARGWLRF
jgi:uncharacterized SAM-binding protein YcdF (DUF218 family)